ncbi:MAG: hypothetical protein HXX11_15130 [Desulfuromonadales bacterium]|nr:hypothetical protein [Desulfuromonadales bacterium]
MENKKNMLRAALAMVLEDDEFMNDDGKVNNVFDAMTYKDGVSKIFRQLQGNGLKDYLVNKEKGKAGASPQDKADWIKGYITARFTKHMVDPNTGARATKLFNAAYPPAVPEHTPEEPEIA